MLISTANADIQLLIVMGISRGVSVYCNQIIYIVLISINISIELSGLRSKLDNIYGNYMYYLFQFLY